MMLQVEGENDMEEIAQDLAVLFEKVTGLKGTTVGLLQAGWVVVVGGG